MGNFGENWATFNFSVWSHCISRSWLLSQFSADHQASNGNAWGSTNRGPRTEWSVTTPHDRPVAADKAPQNFSPGTNTIKLFYCQWSSKAIFWGMISSSATRLAILKTLVTNVVKKVAQIFDNFWCNFEKLYFLRKNCCCYFLGSFWENWATFYSNLWQH